MSEQNQAELHQPKEAASPVTSPATASPKPTPVAALFDILEIVVFAVCATILLFALFFRVCRVDGSSMLQTLRNGETLVTSNLSQIEIGDIVIFHQTSDVYDRFNEALVKRVIATEGQTVRIDYEAGEVYVDGVLLDEPYVALINQSGKHTGIWSLSPSLPGCYDRQTKIFEATVPDGCYFVMGDNRNNSADSRSAEVGFVDARRVLGKAVIRLKPWTIFS
jgi:signal peptidase I